jgi:hypothetical protein
MSNGEFARIKYYRGQMLTARDFEDQQEYHRGKQQLLLRRFPSGIIGGLVVTCPPKGTDPGDVDAFLIGEGLAVDPEGRELVVPEGGLKVPIAEFKPETPYLSLAYEESEELIEHDSCDVNQKNNRVLERIVQGWDPAPNMGSHITVALIQLKDVKDPGTTCDKYNDPMKPVVNVGDPPIRKNARVVDTDQITDGAITDKQIRIGAVTAEKLAPNSVITDKILNLAVTDIKLANNAVVTDKIQNGAVTADKIVDDAVVTDKIQDGAVTQAKLAPNSVVETKIADGAVTDTKLADDAVTTNKIQNAAVIEAKLAPNTVATDKLQNQAVTTDKLADNAITTSKIPNGAVTDIKLASNAVVTDKIQNGAVTAEKLAPNSVITDKILNLAVTDIKLANNAVVTDKIQDGAVTQAKLAPNSVVETKIADGAVTDTKLADDAVITNKIQNAAITEAKLANNAVTSIKLKVIRQLTHSSVGKGETLLATTFSLSPNSIIQVIPTAGELSWTFSVKGGAAGGMLIYRLTIINPGPGSVEFDVREILFN